MIRSTTIRDLFVDQYRPQRLAGRSPQTDECYRDTLNRLAQWHGSDPPAWFLGDDEHIAAFVGWLLERSAAPATANKHLRQLRALSRFAAKKALVAAPFDLPSVPCDYEEPRAWSIDEVGRILAAATRVGGQIEGLTAALWWECLILLLLDCGLRISAFMAVRVADVSLASRAITIRPTQTRGNVSVRQKHRRGQTLNFASQTASRLATFMAADPAREMLFPWPCDRNSRQLKALRSRYTKILAAAGVETGRKCKFQKLRRTTATYISLLGGGLQAAQQQLGHSHERITSASYVDARITHPDAPPKQPACDVIPRPNYPSPDGRQLELF